MKVVQGNMFSALVNSRRYIGDHDTELGDVITPAVIRLLDNSIAELSSTVTAQDRYMRDVKGVVAVKKASYSALIRNHMAPIAAIAKLELGHSPDLVKFSVPRQRVTVQQLAACADGMAEAARPYAQVFIDTGRKPDFIDRLKQAAEQMRSVEADGAQGRVRVKHTTSGLAQKLSRARKVVHVLDAYVKEAVGDDKALLASWNAAKRVVHASSRRKAATATITLSGSAPAGTAIASIPEARQPSSAAAA